MADPRTTEDVKLIDARCIGAYLVAPGPAPTAHPFIGIGERCADRRGTVALCGELATAPVHRVECGAALDLDGSKYVCRRLGECGPGRHRWEAA